MPNVPYVPASPPRAPAQVPPVAASESHETPSRLRRTEAVRVRGVLRRRRFERRLAWEERRQLRRGVAEAKAVPLGQCGAVGAGDHGAGRGGNLEQRAAEETVAVLRLRASVVVLGFGLQEAPQAGAFDRSLRLEGLVRRLPRAAAAVALPIRRFEGVRVAQIEAVAEAEARRGVALAGVR
eukprot:scaffold3340_cov255-Pinguiococcus_pyrenoidosus.AAC.16